MNILAIDLGKFNSMCCFFDTKTQEYSFLNAATTRRYLRTVLEKHPIDLVVMEACGPSGWISDLCRELGLKVLVCSTNEEAWHWKNVKWAQREECYQNRRDGGCQKGWTMNFGEMLARNVPARRVGGNAETASFQR